MTSTTTGPSVSVVIPTFQESGAIDACLDAVAGQTYSNVVEVLVVDGRSTDDTRARATAHEGVRVIDNPARMQAAGLNIGLSEALGEVIVRVDGHCVLQPDYIAACITTLEGTGASLVGGAMTPLAIGTVQRGIASAMGSRFGAGPARFHVGGAPQWVDTVYLGAYRRSVAEAIGGYSTDVGVNEDAEFAHRIAAHGRVRFEPAIRSAYKPRGSIRAVARQFYRYGLSRAATARRHPGSVRPRQLVAPALVVALALVPRRRWILGAYATSIAVATGLDGDGGIGDRAVYSIALPTMHLSWGLGFTLGILGVPPPRPEVEE